MSRYINRVLIEGKIIRGNYSTESHDVYFATVEQQRKYIKFGWNDYFSIYALSPLSKELAHLVEQNKQPIITVEGELRTRALKSSKEVITNILVHKIINVRYEDNQVTENSSQKELTK
ncbi:MAG: DUF3217 domain-containing protein [Mycoplasma sp.]